VVRPALRPGAARAEDGGPRGGAMLKIFMPEIAVAEKILRSVVVYFFLLLALRFMGKRQAG